MLVAALFSSTMMAFRSGKARLAIMPLSVQIPILWRQWMLLTIALLLLVQRSQKMSRFTRWPSPAHDKPTKMILETPAAGKRSRLELGYNSIHVLAFFRQSAKISVEQFFAAHNNSWRNICLSNTRPEIKDFCFEFEQAVGRENRCRGRCETRKVVG